MGKSQEIDQQELIDDTELGRIMEDSDGWKTVQKNSFEDGK